MEYIRASREARHALVISDPQPVGSVANVWVSAGQAANIGIFLLLLGGFLYVGRAILLPILIAAVVAMTLAPLIKAGKRHGISPWITSLLIVAFAIGALALAATAHRRPGQRVDRTRARNRRHHQAEAFGPRSAARGAARTGDVACSAAAAAPRRRQPRRPTWCCRSSPFLTPAAGELLLFFGTLLFFLVGQIELRTRLVSVFSNHEAKLRFLRIMNDIERNLAGYLAVVTIINAVLGTDRRPRRLARRLARSGDLRTAGRALELRALCRPGHHGGDPVRRRPRDLPLARPRAHRAGGTRRLDARSKATSSRRPSSAAG